MGHRESCVAWAVLCRITPKQNGGLFSSDLVAFHGRSPIKIMISSPCWVLTERCSTWVEPRLNPGLSRECGFYPL